MNRRRAFLLATCKLALALSAMSCAIAGVPIAQPATTQRVVAPAPAEPPTDLLFRDFYVLPVGPRGLEPTARLVGLNGHRVRIRGYIAHEEEPTPGVFMLAPFPIEIGDADESLADDLPPTTVFVQLEGGESRALRAARGPVQVAGVLSVGAAEEAGGRVSYVRLRVDPTVADALLLLTPPRDATASVPGVSSKPD